MASKAGMEPGVEYWQQADEALLQLIVLRNPDALAALYDRHAPTIYNTAMRIVREPTNADEVLQDTFWQVWQKAGEFQGTGSVAAWLFRIARNKSLDQLRRQKARAVESVSHTAAGIVDGLAAAAMRSSQVEQISEQAWKQQQVRDALSTLPAEQRVCLELAYFDGLSQRQIAEQTQAPLGTVKTRVRMGLDKLARLLGTVGLQAEDNG